MRRSAVSVQRSSGHCEESLAESLALCGVRMDEPRSGARVNTQVVQKLAFTDEFAYAVTDHVHTDDGPGG